MLQRLVCGGIQYIPVGGGEFCAGQTPEGGAFKCGAGAGKNTRNRTNNLGIDFFVLNCVGRMPKRGRIWRWPTPPQWINQSRPHSHSMADLFGCNKIKTGGTVSTLRLLVSKYTHKISKLMCRMFWKFKSQKFKLYFRIIKRLGIFLWETLDGGAGGRKKAAGWLSAGC